MDTSETISTQVTLPVDLYQAIAHRAQGRGNSVNSELVSLLVALLNDSPLTQEFADWEAASDEDWLNLEATINAAIWQMLNPMDADQS